MTHVSGLSLKAFRLPVLMLFAAIGFIYLRLVPIIRDHFATLLRILNFLIRTRIFGLMIHTALLFQISLHSTYAHLLANLIS